VQQVILLRNSNSQVSVALSFDRRVSVYHMFVSDKSEISDQGIRDVMISSKIDQKFLVIAF
jgi:hypothetical protein